jgi:multicomponent Na+:H+ antiporter subunit F
MFGTKTVLLIAVSGFLSGRPEWLDLALLYALMNFIGTIALLRFSKFQNLADDELATGDLAGENPASNRGSS